MKKEKQADEKLGNYNNDDDEYLELLPEPAFMAKSLHFANTVAVKLNFHHTFNRLYLGGHLAAGNLDS